MKDKSKAIAADENDVAVTKDFEKFLTDFSANKIDTASKELEVIFPKLKKDVTNPGILTRCLHFRPGQAAGESQCLRQCTRQV